MSRTQILIHYWRPVHTARTPEAQVEPQNGSTSSWEKNGIPTSSTLHKTVPLKIDEAAAAIK